MPALQIAQGNDDATAIAVAAFVIALDGHDTNTALRLFDRALELSDSNVFALVGQQFSLTRERIRQIEARALRKLKHPSRSSVLRSFLNN